MELNTESDVTLNGAIAVGVVDGKGSDRRVMEHLLANIERGFGVVFSQSYIALMGLTQNGVVWLLFKLHMYVHH
jgi:hypothetical protein